jgi:lipoyl(octanoyl) transferase
MVLDVQCLGRTEWRDTFALQEEMVEQRQAGEIDDTILLLEHEPVITIGRTPDKSSLLQVEASGIPVIETNRGGQATYHGPGQLVGYCIVDLTAQGRDLHVHLRRLESGVIEICRHFGIAAKRRVGLTGVWVGQRKLASIGVGVRRWVTMHGFALNVMPESLVGFAPIVPCGIADVQMTCMAQETATPLTMESVIACAGEVFLGDLDAM